MFNGVYIQYMYMLVICEAVLSSHVILQDEIFKTFSGDKIELPLMGSLSKGRRPT